MKAWITKYALTQGIYAKEGEIAENCPTMFVGKEKGRSDDYYHRPYWHLTEDEAIAHAKEMQKKKIASLKKSIAKIEKLEFTKTEENPMTQEEN